MRGNPVLWSSLALALVLPVSAGAQLQVLDPRFEVFNEFPVPADLNPNLGDLMFGADGSITYVVTASESSLSAVWAAAVVRDAAGGVISFGTFSEVFVDPMIDTGLTLAPGSDTLFYRVLNAIAQRRADGAIEQEPIVDYGGTFGGLAFLPAGYPNAGSLLSASYGEAAVYLHPVSDDGDGTFTIGEPTLWADLGLGVDDLGDVEVVASGPLAGSLLGTSFSADPATLFTLEIDPATGLPAGGTTPAVTAFATGLSNGWGVAIDPITGNPWSIRFSAGSPALIQIRVKPPLFADGFETGDTSAWTASTP